MNCHRGDIVLVLFPDSNLRTSKRRPALVVQAGDLGADLPQTIVAMITSNIARAGHPSRVMVRVDGENAKRSGLLMDSVIMTDNLATIHYSEIDRVIGGSHVAEGTRRDAANHPGIVAGAKACVRSVAATERIQSAERRLLTHVDCFRKAEDYRPML